MTQPTERLRHLFLNLRITKSENLKMTDSCFFQILNFSDFQV